MSGSSSRQSTRRRRKPCWAEKALNRAIGKAIASYDLVRHGDRIAIAVSGGSDSLALWKMMVERQRRAPVDYEVVGVHVDLGFGAETGQRLEEFARRAGYDFHWRRTSIGPMAHGPTNSENPCFLCARLRRKLLFETSAELGCNSLALGHNMDDAIETFFINTLYTGEISTIRPSQSFFQGRLHVIRPLIFAEKKWIRRYAREHELPLVTSGCPSEEASDTRRMRIRQMLAGLYREDGRIRRSIFRALHRDRVKSDYLL